MKKNSEYIGVNDEFVPENEKYVDGATTENKDRSRKTAKKIAIGYGIFLCTMFIVVIAVGIFGVTRLVNFAKDKKEELDKAPEVMEQTVNNVFEKVEKVQDFTEKKTNEILDNNEKVKDQIQEKLDKKNEEVNKKVEDTEKLQEEINKAKEEAMDYLNSDAAQKDLEKAMEDLNSDDVQKELEKAMEYLNSDAAQKELQDAQKKAEELKKQMGIK